MTREEAIKELEEDKALYMPEEWIESLDRDTPDGRLITALDMAIKALLQEPKWIPVKEKLPEIQDGMLRSDIVWSCQKYGDGYMWQSTDQCTSDGTWISEVPFDDPRERCKVVAWMPLPEPYQEGVTK